MTGHGGNEFLKFQDNEEISAFDIADAFEQMWQKKRYNEIFFMIDTCQANTMYSKFYSPNIVATGSSELGENSYSHENDHDIGVAVIDSYTHYVLQYLEQINKTSKATMADLFANYNPVLIKSHAGVRSDLFNRPLSEAKVTDFFGGVAQVEVLEENVPSWTWQESTRQQKPASHQSASKLVSYSRSSSSSSSVKPRLQAAWDVGSGKREERLDLSRAWAATALVAGLVLWSRLRTLS
ncbi:glycosylphosphatidylinositol anchor biosynthesis [Ceratobasidium sp. 392]|nr:glycosylphosphatidylinositol anchor biosynthesis [Ceratobasidium sp. 392]